MVGFAKGCPEDDLKCLNFFITATGPWRDGTLSGQKGCPSFADSFDRTF